MIKLGAAMWVGVVGVAATAAFGISFEVQELRDRLGAVNRDIASEEDTIRVLKAEWAYMTQPTRLREMAQDYTDLVPITPAQMLETASALPMPLRSPDAPPVNGDPATEGGGAVPLLATIEVPGFGIAPLPARRGEPRIGIPDAVAGVAAPRAGTGAATPPAAAPAVTTPSVAATTAAAAPAHTPTVRVPTPPPAAAAPRPTPAAPEDDPIAALLVSFQKAP